MEMPEKRANAPVNAEAVMRNIDTECQMKKMLHVSIKKARKSGNMNYVKRAEKLLEQIKEKK